ncbi:hypothetical protein [Leeuwenhoekiella sp.]|uniref:phage tail tube protein n=1 Tax=Leeuwenhoekiella sp. TaxID=1977054 RepID=UPI000C48159E|nr:hypothetical protein [Leeuwenhoekiella sp.]MAO42160.1 hypothetical protein [Leeuwenhoekiella sp.]|tara:strand:+ start:135 stop:653 length:519 start_codon:yes stop_codon:yes gene_type:complete
MPKYRYGLASLKIDDINAADGLGAGSPTELKDDVYRDTFNIVEEEGTSTPVYNEMDVDPVMEFTEKGRISATLQIMDTSVDTLALLCGGEVVTIAGTSKTWSRPSENLHVEKRLEFETQDGYKIIIPRGRVNARINHQVRRNGIALVDVTIMALKPLVDGLAAFDMVEPIEA